MQISASDLAQLLQGVVEGDGNVLVSQPNKIEIAGEGDITFLANPKYESYAYTTKASILLVSKDFKPKQAIVSTLVRVDDVYASIALLLDKFGGAKNTQTGISPQVSVHNTAKIGENVSLGHYAVVLEGASIGKGTVISPQVFVGNHVQIGENCIIYPGVKIHDNCIIGNHCIIHANTVIGADGFGFAPQEDGTYKKVAQTGNVVIGNHVEVGANCAIDRATMGSTIIKDGVKLDNLIMVAHNVEIGEHTVVAAQAGFAGSSKIGSACMIGGQAGFVGHVQIADGTKVQAQSGVAKNVKQENTALYGSPALDYNQYLKSYAAFKQLPSLMKKMRALEQQLKSLEDKE